MKTAIGIDIGGTKISVVKGTLAGKILEQEIIPTLTGKETRRAVQSLLDTVKKIAVDSGAGGRPLGVGVGIPGPVNPSQGVVPRSPHLSGWEGLRLAKMLERAAGGLKVIMANDANAAALGEKVFGQGRGLRDFIYLTVSTGIGGGIVAGGRLLEGASFVAGEVGHMAIVAGGASCKCGRKGCLEAYASGTAIARLFKEALQSGRKSKYFGKPVFSFSAKQIGEAALKGDRLALEIFKQAGFFLGVGIANLLNILNPQKIILGGGVLKSAPGVFWAAMRESAKSQAWPQAWKSAGIARSSLGGHAGDLGALALVFESLSPSRP